MGDLFLVDPVELSNKHFEHESSRLKGEFVVNTTKFGNPNFRDALMERYIREEKYFICSFLQNAFAEFDIQRSVPSQC